MIANDLLILAIRFDDSEMAETASYNKFKQCDIVYPAGNNLYTEKVEVVVTMAGFVMIRYPERKGWTHVRESSLYSAKDEAEASIKK